MGGKKVLIQEVWERNTLLQYILHLLCKRGVPDSQILASILVVSEWILTYYEIILIH